MNQLGVKEHNCEHVTGVNGSLFETRLPVALHCRRETKRESGRDADVNQRWVIIPTNIFYTHIVALESLPVLQSLESDRPLEVVFIGESRCEQ